MLYSTYVRPLFLCSIGDLLIQVWLYTVSIETKKNYNLNRKELNFWTYYLFICPNYEFHQFWTFGGEYFFDRDIIRVQAVNFLTKKFNMKAKIQQPILMWNVQKMMLTPKSWFHLSQLWIPPILMNFEH
jgi:hypothetical protein